MPDLAYPPFQIRKHFHPLSVHAAYLIHHIIPLKTESVAVLDVFFNVKFILFVKLGCVLVIGVLFQIIFGRKEGREPSKLQDTLVSRHGGDLAGGHQLPAKPLHILAVTFRLSTASALGLHGDGGLAQPVFRNIPVSYTHLTVKKQSKLMWILEEQVIAEIRERFLFLVLLPLIMPWQAVELSLIHI